MVNAQVAVLADPLGIKGSIMVLALAGLLGSAFGMVAILAHAVGIVLLASMITL
jgi:hypothetical protein